MHRILTIAHNTFREAVRDRVLYNLVLFVLLITASAIFLGELTDGEEARTIVNLGLSAMLLFGAFIAVFVGVSLVSKEIEKRTIYAIFAKPVGRGEFVVGKYLGQLNYLRRRCENFCRLEVLPFAAAAAVRASCSRSDLLAF